MENPTDLVLLRAVALGGRVEPAAAARRVGVDADAVTGDLEAAERRGLMVEQRGMYRLTEAGRDALAHLLAVERAELGTSVATQLYERFCTVNDEFKRYVTDLQLSGEDPVTRLAQLEQIHRAVQPLVAEATAISPRLAPFEGRFRTAYDAVAAGDGRYVSHPLVDSYHGIWFELHEELIHLAGLSRSEEAAQGRA